MELINLLWSSPISKGLLIGILYLVKFYPLWLPFFLAFAFWRLWIAYVQSKFIAAQEYVLLEFKLPREIEKTPLAMELTLTNMILSAGETDFWSRVWKGKVRAWFSFEIVSMGGAVHFFVWTRKALRSFLEAQVYANYPTVEVHEVPDYARELFYNPEKVSFWGCDMILTKPDPYPIKTYVDYGLDKEQVEEEMKVDPLGPLIEFWGAMKKGEIMALQIIARAHKKRYFPEGLFEREDKWKDDAIKEVEKIRKGSIIITEGEDGVTLPTPTKGKQEIIAALERSVSKPGFDAGVRIMYYAENEHFKGVNIPSMLASFKQFGSNSLNSFAPSRWLAGFDYPWQDLLEIRQNRKRRQFLRAWKRRSYFHAPFKFKPSILNTEEMATLFHFPGRVVETPTFGRIPSRKAGAPGNLPV